MADAAQLDPADRTPLEVLVAMGENRSAFPNDACIPCGAVIHMGFFFDGFGRHRDHDDPATSRYSNICRLWESHRDNKDERRKVIQNQFWYPFYYSGLGTELNREAREALVSPVAFKTMSAGAKALQAKIDPRDTVKDGVKKGLVEFSYRPVVESFHEIAERAAKTRRLAGRILKLAPDRWVRLGRAAVRSSLHDIKRNPLKAAQTVAREVFAGVALDSIPWFRDHPAIARLIGTGVTDRLAAAMIQFQNAIAEVKQKMPRLQRIQVSIFGADRGGVLARALANELAERYRHPGKATLAFVDPRDSNRTAVPVQIKFLGLLDAVSSLMAENQLLGLLPVVGMIRQNYGERKLAVPASVERCVHFAAAHELRFYQRLDSLEKTRGLQYLYPGTSEDITGGAPPGTLGARAELQRVVLRDMLHEAISYGVALDLMENMGKWKSETFKKFTLAQSISDGKATYRMAELIAAYREIVPRVPGLNFTDHMQVFLRWIAVRYQSPAFRSSVTAHSDRLVARHQSLRQERERAQAEYEALRNQRPAADVRTLATAQVRLDDANRAEMQAFREATIEKTRPSEGVWERLEREAADWMQRDAEQTGLRRAVNQLRDKPPGTVHPGGRRPEADASIIESRMMTPGQEQLVHAWQMGLSGTNPLPPKVMALFDLLVHDSMLTSWHDHLLSPTLYFQTRATDTFGESDYVGEEKQRMRDERAAEHARRVSELVVPAPR
ncbi:MAG: hypothetical protein EPN70_23380 [Paraburkholderia sp.]|uniref:DUF2235 domain-containing protein n=1 Tax=Paraburkholderia sp. TaxID=1926495 RepID=UPI001211AA1A|nr:DUF2235 domain-containing protein [Paraburkholderia sp.]TAM00110.1 MAG: hypothetical protein EPN70_23380 [Paraburkholderia sp.]